MAPGRKSSQKRMQEAMAARKRAADEHAAAAAAAAVAAASEKSGASEAAGRAASTSASRMVVHKITKHVEAATSGSSSSAAEMASAAKEMAAKAAEMAAAAEAARVAEAAAEDAREVEVAVPELPETGDAQISSSSRGADAREDGQAPRLSIRTSKYKPPEMVDMDTGNEVQPGKRYVVVGTKTQFLKRANGDQPLKVKYAKQHRGPSTKEYRTLMSRDIGCAVRTKLPMLKANYVQLESEHKQAFEDYLKSLYHLPPTEFDMWGYIDRTATKTYREWKHECHHHYTDVSKDLPAEFIHRPNEWAWLSSHFEDPDFKKLCEKNAANRNKGKVEGSAINHHSGTIPYSYRVEANMEKGSLAPFLQTICDVYGPSQNAQSMLAAIKRKMDEMVSSQSSEGGNSEIIPMEDKLKVIEEEMANGRAGTTHRGLGNAARRAAKPRGGARLSHDRRVYDASMQETIKAQQEKLNAQQEKLNAVQQEMADMKAKMSQLFAAQANAGVDEHIPVPASPNFPSKSSQAGNHDIDEDEFMEDLG